MERIYAAIDLKSFFASVECRKRNLDPLTTNLVVADNTRTEKTICLAISPSLKAYGLPGRARLFEVVQKVKNINNDINSIKYGWTKDKSTLPDSWIYVEKDETKVQASKDLTSGDNNTYFLCVSIQTSSNVENFIAED